MATTVISNTDNRGVSNPVTDLDGTKTYWAGRTTEWGIQAAIDDASPGDTVVIRGGTYEVQPRVDKPNLTIRPFVDHDGEWEAVTFLIPRGRPAVSGWAMYVGGNTAGTHIGRPETHRTTPDGDTTESTIVPGEFEAVGEVVPLRVSEIGGRAFCFRAHALHHTGVLSVEGKAVVDSCDFRSSTGYGGGVVLTGGENTTTFARCTFLRLFADGSEFDTGHPGPNPTNHVISIDGAEPGRMNYRFIECEIEHCMGDAVVSQRGGEGAWFRTRIQNNIALAFVSGTVRLVGCHPSFLECDFVRNQSGLGTVYIDGRGMNSQKPLTVIECLFESNATSDGVYGGVFFAVDHEEASGEAPKLLLEGNEVVGNNALGESGDSGVKWEDFVSPWFPTYRGSGMDDGDATGTDPAGGHLEQDPQQYDGMDGMDQDPRLETRSQDGSL